jgi:hypothetical protein
MLRIGNFGTFPGRLKLSERSYGERRSDSNKPSASSRCLPTAVERWHGVNGV